MHDQTEDTTANDVNSLARTEYLIQNPVNLTINGEKGITRLHLFAMHGQKKLIKRFIDKGCCLNERTSTGKTPLDISIEYGHFDIAEMLLRAKAAMPISKVLTERAFVKILKNLNKCKKYVRDRFYNVIKSTKSLMEIVDLLKKRNSSVLTTAVIMQDRVLTAFILHFGLEKDKKDASESLYYSFETQDWPNFDTLMNFGRFHQHGMYCFFNCLKYMALSPNRSEEHLAFLTHLLERINNWRVWDEHTASKICDIFEKADEHILLIFLRLEVQLRTRKLANIDIIVHGFGNEKPRVIDFITQSTRRYEFGLGRGGKGPLHLAMKSCIVENIPELCRKRVSCNHRDVMGRTPLFEVFNSKKNVEKKEKCVLALVTMFDADVQVFDYQGQSLLDFHRNEDDWKLIQIILAHLAHLDWCGCRIDQRIRQKIIGNERFNNYYIMCKQHLEMINSPKLIFGTYVPDCNESPSTIVKFLLSKIDPSNQFNVYYTSRFELIVPNIKSIKCSKNNLLAILFEGMTDFHIAAMLGNENWTRNCIQEGYCMNTQTFSRKTPIELAVEHLNFGVVKILLQAKAQFPQSAKAVQRIFKAVLRNILNVPALVCKEIYKAIRLSKSLMDVFELIRESQCAFAAVVMMGDPELTKNYIDSHYGIQEPEEFYSIDVAIKSADLPNLEVLLHCGIFRLSRAVRFFKVIEDIAIYRKGTTEYMELLPSVIKKLPMWDVWNRDVILPIGNIFEQAEEYIIKLCMDYNIHVRIKTLFDVDVVVHCFGNNKPGIKELMKSYIEAKYLPGLGYDRKCGLHFALKAGILENVQLLDKIVNCNHRDAKGRTPLFEIFFNFGTPSDEKIEQIHQCVLWLIGVGADVQVVDDYAMDLFDFICLDHNLPNIKAFIAHLVLHESIGHTIDPAIRKKIDERVEYSSYYKMCHRQLQRMKETNVGKTETEYRFIIMHRYHPDHYVQNEDC